MILKHTRTTACNRVIRRYLSSSSSNATPVRCRPKRIILVRHGESMGNVNDTLYATIPDNRLPLTPKGMAQAKGCGVKLRKIIGDETSCFYVSPYIRTRQTFLGIIKAFDERKYTSREEPRLREQDFGNFQNVQKIRQHRQERRAFGSFYYRFEQGESGADVYDRVTTFLESMHREFVAGCAENFILISHGLTSRLFLMRYFHWKVEYFQQLENLKHCQIVILDDENGRFHLKEEIPSRTDLNTITSLDDDDLSNIPLHDDDDDETVVAIPTVS